jgi:hypothetical protein
MLTYVYDEEEQPGSPLQRVYMWAQPMNQMDRGVKGYNKDMLTVMTCYFHTHLQVLGLDTTDGFNKHQDSSFHW